MSVRLKLTLSYAGFLLLAGALLLAAVWCYLLRYVPDRALLIRRGAPTPPRRASNRASSRSAPSSCGPSPRPRRS